jgi:hypothetical protein
VGFSGALTVSCETVSFLVLHVLLAPIDYDRDSKQSLVLLSVTMYNVKQLKEKCSQVVVCNISEVLLAFAVAA